MNMEKTLEQIVDEALKVFEPSIEHVGGNLYKVTNGNFIVYTNKKGVDAILNTK